jgi:hypothetical protein
VKPCAAQLPSWAPKALSGFAFVSTLIGTIVAGAGTSSIKNVADLFSAFYTAASASTSSPAFGCSIAATIIQAAALGVDFLPVPAAAAPKLTAAPPV